MSAAAIDRLLARCSETDSGCWVYPKPRRDGYVVVGVEGRSLYAHRLTYEFFVDRIPKGLHLDHLCRTRACVNPWHTEPVTPRVNNARGESPSAKNASKTHCPQGHKYDEHNTYRWTAESGRQCMTCIVERNRQYRSSAPAWRTE